jgi:hypothetical protein
MRRYCCSTLAVTPPPPHSLRLRSQRLRKAPPLRAASGAPRQKRRRITRSSLAWEGSSDFFFIFFSNFFSILFCQPRRVSCMQHQQAPYPPSNIPPHTHTLTAGLRRRAENTVATAAHMPIFVSFFFQYFLQGRKIQVATAANMPRSAFCINICTFVPVKYLAATPAPTPAQPPHPPRPPSAAPGPQVSVFVLLY